MNIEKKRAYKLILVKLLVLTHAQVLNCATHAHTKGNACSYGFLSGYLDICESVKTP